MDLLIPLDRDAGQPLRDQIYIAIRTAIVDGKLAAGARLPSTRELARHLGVSRLTVDDAYARMTAEEYIEGRRGSGTFVGTTITRPVTAHAIARPRGRHDGRMSRWGAAIDMSPSPPSAQTHRRYNLTAGTPALDVFPQAIWQRIQARVARNESYDHFDYGPDAGLPELREALAGYLARSRGVRCDPEQIVITSGTQQSIDLLTRLMVDPGDRVLIEEPGYPSVRGILELAGADIVPLPVDRYGLPTDRLVNADANATVAAKIAYVTPSHQYPTGAMLPLARRLALLRWAGCTGTLVIEDDYDSELRYDARPIPALAALASTDPELGEVAYLGTFSKVLFPALRLGYAVLDPDLAARFAAAKRIVDRHPASQLQAAAAIFITEGHFERHLVRMRRLYAARQAILIDALDRHLAGVAVRNETIPSAGLHVLTRFDLEMSERELLSRAAAAGIALTGAGVCFMTPPARPHLLIGYAAMPEERIMEAVRKLAQVLGG